MNKLQWKLTAITAAAAMSLPASAAVDLGAVTLNGLTSLGGCNTSILSPDATQCFGVVLGNNLGSSAPGATATESFINATWGPLGASSSTSYTVNSPLDASAAPGFQINLGGWTGDLVIALKQASAFSLYFWDNAVNVSSVTFMNNGGFSNNTDNLGISHYTVYGVNAIPEPETYALMLAGLGLVGFMARRRRQQT